MFDNHYFFTFEINKIKEKSIPIFLTKRINRFLSWRLKKVWYCEPMANFEGKTIIVIGSLQAKQKVNRNGLIFLLELYAHLKDPNIKVSDDFKSKIIKSASIP